MMSDEGNHPIRLLPIQNIVPTLNESGLIQKEVTRDHFSQYPSTNMTLRSLRREANNVQTECILYSPIVTPVAEDELIINLTHVDVDDTNVYNSPAQCVASGVIAADTVKLIEFTIVTWHLVAWHLGGFEGVTLIQLQGGPEN